VIGPGQERYGLSGFGEGDGEAERLDLADVVRSLRSVGDLRPALSKNRSAQAFTRGLRAEIITAATPRWQAHPRPAIR
jgi:hypothetical protein